MSLHANRYFGFPAWLLSRRPLLYNLRIGTLVFQPGFSAGVHSFGIISSLGYLPWLCISGLDSGVGHTPIEILGWDLHHHGLLLITYLSGLRGELGIYSWEKVWGLWDHGICTVILFSEVQ